jgi:hypothetical protein
MEKQFVVHVDLEGDLQDFTVHGFTTRELAEDKAIELVKAGFVSDTRITNAGTITTFYPGHKVRRIEVKESDRLVAPPPSHVKK